MMRSATARLMESVEHDHDRTRQLVMCGLLALETRGYEPEFRRVSDLAATSPQKFASGCNRD
jgi:hypothetical protein